jgi:hypothetical protein
MHFIFLHLTRKIIAYCSDKSEHNWQEHDLSPPVHCQSEDEMCYTVTHMILVSSCISYLSTGCAWSMSLNFGYDIRMPKTRNIPVSIRSQPSQLYSTAQRVHLKCFFRMPPPPWNNMGIRPITHFNNNFVTKYNIWSFHGCDYEECRLLWYEIVWLMQ